MKPRPKIEKIEYRWAALDLPHKRKLTRTVIYESFDLSDKVKKAIYESQLLGTGGVYGHEVVDDPYDIRFLKIFHESGSTEVVVARDVAELPPAGDIYERMVRVCSVIDEELEAFGRNSNRSERRSVEPVAQAPSVPRQPASSTGKREVYQIKVVLNGTKPPVWRRFLMPSKINLHGLHHVLQVVMGWTNTHPYYFEIDRQEYSLICDDIDDPYTEDSTRFAIGDVVKKGDKFLYVYDFGDDWRHKLVVEDVLEYGAEEECLRCLKGRRACPPEDCGGAWGYEELLKVLKDPSHEEHRTLMAWLDGPFDPDLFEVDAVDARLREIWLAFLARYENKMAPEYPYSKN